MKVAIATIIVAAVAGVSARPSGHPGHRHMHRSAHIDHEAREEGLKPREFVIAHRPPPPPPTTTSTSTTHTHTHASKPPPPTTSSSTTSTSSTSSDPPTTSSSTSSTSSDSSTSKEAPSTSSTTSSTSSSADVTSSTSTQEKPASTEEKATSTEEKTASSSSSKSGGGYAPFCGGKSKRATLGEIAYKGNTGGGSGCNLMTVPADVADKYDYTATFTNKGGSSANCACWNKIGPSGLINGFFTGNQAITFSIPSGGSTVVAIDDNSQGGCTCGSGSLPLTGIGEFAGTWLEFDAGNESNGKWSGADASCLVAAAAGLKIPALSVCFNGDCSTIHSGGTGINAYLAGMEAADGVGLNIAPGGFALEVTVG